MLTTFGASAYSLTRWPYTTLQSNRSLLSRYLIQLLNSNGGLSCNDSMSTISIAFRRWPRSVGNISFTLISLGGLYVSMTWTFRSVTSRSKGKLLDCFDWSFNFAGADYIPGLLFGSSAFSCGVMHAIYRLQYIGCSSVPQVRAFTVTGIKPLS